MQMHIKNIFLGIRILNNRFLGIRILNNFVSAIKHIFWWDSHILNNFLLAFVFKKEKMHSYTKTVFLVKNMLLGILIKKIGCFIAGSFANAQENYEILGLNAP